MLTRKIQRQGPQGDTQVPGVTDDATILGPQQEPQRFLSAGAPWSPCLQAPVSGATTVVNMPWP